MHPDRRSQKSWIQLDLEVVVLQESILSIYTLETAFVHAQLDMIISGHGLIAHLRVAFHS